MKQSKELDCRAIASVIANEAFGYNGSDKTNPPMTGLIFAGETLKETVEYALTQQRTELLEEINKIFKPIGTNGKKENLSIEKAYSKMSESQANMFKIRIKAINKDRKGKLKEITNLLNKKDETK